MSLRHMSCTVHIEMYSQGVTDATLTKAGSQCLCTTFFFQAQRNNEDVAAIQPLFSVNVDHRVSCLYSS